MELIDKDVVIAEIERLQDSIASTVIDNRINKEQAEAYRVCVKLRSFIEDTLEVKENNLVEKLDYNDYMAFFKEHPKYTAIYFEDLKKHLNLTNTATHLVLNNRKENKLWFKKILK